MKQGRMPKVGECYRHFKGNRYRVLAIAKHTERTEELVVYEGLYGEHPVFARPLEMFLEQVDKRKFPDADQEYRFELEEETAVADEEEQSLIMRFLDLSSNEEKLRFLQKYKTELTDEFLSAAAQSMDFTENAQTMEMRYQQLVKYIKTLMKYEKRM